MATKYKRYSRGGRFKGADIGDAGISALRQRDAQIVEGIERQRRQHEEISRDHLSGIDRAFKLEADNMAELQALEDKIYQNKRDNIKLRGQREVEALKGKADEYGRQAEHWKELTPKLGKSLQQLSEGFGHVANKLGYEQARADAAEDGHSTLDMWGVLPKEYEKVSDANEEGANKADYLLKKQIEEGSFSKTQELALDSTGVFWKNGRVHYLAKNILGNINQHFDEGLRAYSEMFGPPKTAADYERASRWILSTIESTYGLSNSHYNSSVQELRKKFREVAGTNGYAFTTARNNQISETKINESATIFSANPTEKNFHRLIWTTKRFGGQKNDAGTFIPHTNQSAIRQIVSIWAADLDLDDNEFSRRLGMLTPEDGRQSGNAGNGYDKSQIAGRDLGLYQFAIDIRAKAKRNKASALDAAETHAGNKATVDTFQWALGLGEYGEGGSREKEAFDGSREAMEARIKELDMVAPEAAKKYKPFLMELTNSGHNLKLMKDQANSLITNGNFVEALRYIESNPIFNREDKRDLLNRIPFVTDLGSINVEVSDMNKSIEAELKYALGWDGSKVFYDPSVKYALNAARQKLQARFEHYKDKGEPIERAYAAAWTDVKTLIGSKKGAFAVKKRKNGTYFFSSFSDSASEVDSKMYSPYELNTILNSSTMNGAEFLLNIAIKGAGLEDKNIFSSNVVNNWAEEFRQTGTFTSNAVIDRIARDLPVGHELRNNKAGIIRRILEERDDKQLKELAKTIPDDTKVVASNYIKDLPGYESFSERILNARSKEEVQTVLGLYQSYLSNNQLPVRNNVRAKITGSNYLDAFLTNAYGGKFKGVKVISSPVTRNKTETYNEFRLGDGEATARLIEEGWHYGFAYDFKTKTFYEVD